jgi:tetratricopeptide (TPR) repeat protein
MTFALYARSVNSPLSYYDDDLYLLEDPRIQELSFGNLWPILTGSFAANYHPVTTLTYAADRAIWGGWLPGFHLTQLAFYSAGIVLLYLLFWTVLGSRPAAFAAAGTYAAHTIHVEAVAWLAQRKDTVCLVFYVASILAYLRHAAEKERPRRYYGASLALAAAAMLSKGYAVVLPAVFIAYDLCFRTRFRARQILDKLPFVALAAAVTALTFLAQDKHSALLGAGEFGMAPLDRFVILAKVFAVYVGRSLLPVRLSVLYIVNTEWLSGWVGLLGIALGLGAFAGFLVLRRKSPGAAFGLALFVLPLSTVMNVFWTLRTWINDRYLFFPTIGSTLAFAAGGLWLYRNEDVPRSFRRWAIPAAAAGTIALYAALTVSRIGVWDSPVCLWSDAVRKQLGLRGSGPLAVCELEGQRLSDLTPLMRLQEAYMLEGRHEDANAIMEALGEVPEDLKRGNELPFAKREIDAGRYDDAIRILRPVVELGRWRAAEAWAWIGKAHLGKGESQEARLACEKAVDLGRKSGRKGAREMVGAMIELGTIEFKARRFQRAAEWYRRSRGEAAPNNPRPVFNLALALEKLGQHEEAYRLCEEALQLEGRVPATIIFDFSDVHLEAGILAEKLGGTEEAVRHFEDALRISPEHPQREGILAKIRNLRGGPAVP